MTGSPRGRAAVLPSAGYVRPPQVDSSGLIVTHVTEDGSTTTVFDFSDLECPPDLLRSLVDGFAVACGQDGRWRAARSAKNGAAAMRSFIRTVAEHPDPPARIEDIGPETWWLWRGRLQATNRWPSVIHLVQGLLAGTPGLPASTRRALRARSPKPKSRLYDAYSGDEFQRIRSAAARMIRTAERRIETNMSTLRAYYAGEETDDTSEHWVHGEKWTAGAMLDLLARHGTLPPYLLNAHLPFRRILNLEGAATTNEALFPNSAEMLSVCVLLVCERGYNCSVIDNLTIDVDRADDHRDDDAVHVLHIDKPRRGPQARYSDESLTSEASRTITRTMALTAQARETVALLGSPTSSLLLFRISTPCGRRGAELFKTTLPNRAHFVERWQDQTALLTDAGNPLKLSLQRLRLSEQVLNNRPRQNSPEVSESIYRRPDPQTRKEAAAVIVRGQTEAIEHARVTVAMRAVSDLDIEAAQKDPTQLAQRLGVAPEKIGLLLSGALNTATGACLDFTNSPFAESAGQRCPASFLACMGCSNAVATPAHLPRLVALADALERTGSAVTREVWLEDYANHYARLTDLLTSNTTPQQRDHARRQITTIDETNIMRLLSRGLDQ